MRKAKIRNRKYKIWNLFLLLTAGLLVCYMVTTMYIGGSVNIREFLSSGRVYDFNQKDLRESSKNWQYSQEEDGYWIQKQKALNKWKIDGSQSSWSFLYLTIDEMSMPGMETHIIYYNRAGEKVIEQTEVLTPGENVIVLQYPGVHMYCMGLRIYGAKGQFLSIGSMQLREKASGFVVRRFIKIMAVAYSGFLAMCMVLFCLDRKFGWKKRIAGKVQNQWMEVLQHTYKVLIEDVCRNVHQRMGTGQRSFWRCLLFSLLFLWMTAGNLAGWYRDAQEHRYYMLSISGLIVAIAVLAWKAPLQSVNWKKPLSRTWLWLWIGTLISDVFVVSGYKWHGIVMIFAGGLLIFVWNNMQRPRQLIQEMLWALEIDFGVAVLYCMFFRTKKLAIRYNGIFKDSGQFSMYAVFMLAVFLIELDWQIRRKEELRKYIIYVTGAAMSFYFVLRAANETGYAATAAIVLILAVREIYRRRDWMEKWRTLLQYGIKAGIVAFLCVCVVHVSTKYLPAFLNTEVTYRNETLISNLSPEVMQEFDALQPGLMDGVTSKQNIEYGIKWQNYLRRLGLTGSDEKIKVHRKTTLAYNGYIQMMYRYGLFILLPCLALQICMVQKGIGGVRQQKEDADLWLLMVAVIYIFFCIFGNVEQAFGHPLWFCYYIGAGYWFREERIAD